MERMPGEERCHYETSPKGSGHPPQYEEKQDGIGGVDGNVHRVMRPWPHSKELAVCGMGNPRQWVPIARVACLKEPREFMRCEAAVDVEVVYDVGCVIQADE